MQRQGHRARQQTRRLSQSAAPQQTRRGRRTATAQFHAWCRNASATIRWTGFSRAATAFRGFATAAIGRALR